MPMARTKPTLLPTRVTGSCSVQRVVKVKATKDFQLFNIETKKLFFISMEKGQALPTYR
jgi:hypothetical protein